MTKKLKQVEKWKYEMTEKDKDELTFAPKINKNTQKILSQRFENPENTVRAKERKIMKLKEFEQLEKQK